MAPSTRLTSEAKDKIRQLSGNGKIWRLTFGFLPATGLETAIGVDEEEGVREDVEHRLETILDFLGSRDTRRVDVVDTGADLVRVAVVLEGVQELHVALGGLNRDDIGIKTLDRREDIVKVGVAEVRVGLELIGNTSGGELERVNGPLEVSVPVRAAERQLERRSERY